MTKEQKLTVEAWRPELSEEWDKALLQMAQSCFIHSRKFLAYHGDKFIDRSLAVRGEFGEIRAIFPACLALNDPFTVVSHPGTTHAGLLHHVAMKAGEAREIFHAVLNHYRDNGMKHLHIKPVPHHIHRVQSGFENWLLWQSGASINRVDLWNVLDLSQQPRISNGCKDNVRKAKKSGVRLVEVDKKNPEHFYSLLRSNLEEKYSTTPVHTLDEIASLMRTFPSEIILREAISPEGDLLAGVLLFVFGEHTVHSQYIASSREGRARSALSMLLVSIIEDFSKSGFKYFSFGASTDNFGHRLNTGLFDFKTSFGRGSIAVAHFSLNL